LPLYSQYTYSLPGLKSFWEGVSYSITRKFDCAVFMLWFGIVGVGYAWVASYAVGAVVVGVIVRGGFKVMFAFILFLFQKRQWVRSISLLITYPNLYNYFLQIRIPEAPLFYVIYSLC